MIKVLLCKADRYAAFRDMFELFNSNCSKHVIPDDFLTLDETLYAMRTHIAFKQFNPNKPAKYGLLFKSINSSRYRFTFITAAYAGKPKGVAGRFYVPGTDDIVIDLVTRLKRFVNLRGRNISYDRLYTSIPLAKWLLQEGITSVGTLQTNRRGIPAEIKITEGEEFTYRVLWEKSEKKISLHSYLVKTVRERGMFWFCLL